jgi:hypothetical protein
VSQTNTPPVNSLTQNLPFANAFRLALENDSTDTLATLLPTLVSPLSISFSELRDQIDTFFARISQASETEGDLTITMSIIPWLMMASAVVFEFARQRSKPSPIDPLLPLASPPGVFSFGREVTDEC